MGREHEYIRRAIPRGDVVLMPGEIDRAPEALGSNPSIYLVPVRSVADDGKQRAVARLRRHGSPGIEQSRYVLFRRQTTHEEREHRAIQTQRATRNHPFLGGGRPKLAAVDSVWYQVDAFFRNAESNRFD